jgi:hypothetical protein
MKNEYLVKGSLAMTRGSFLRIEDGAGLLVYVWEGRLWLTQERELRDRWLKPGDWFRLDRDGATVVQALERAVVTITAPAPERYAKRIALARAGTELPVEIYSTASL